MESEANGSPGSEIKEDDEVAMGEDLEMGEDDGAMGEDDGADDGAEMGEGELTPRPRKPSGRQVGYDGDDDDNEPFETPLTLRRKNREDKWHYMKHAQGHGLEQEETVKRKRDQMEEDGKKGTKGNMFGIKVGLTYFDFGISFIPFRDSRLSTNQSKSRGLRLSPS